MANLTGPEPEPLTSAELLALRDRCVRLSEGGKGLETIMIARLAIDADHLALMIDRRNHQKRFDLWVQVRTKKKPAAKPKTAAKRRKS